MLLLHGGSRLIDEWFSWVLRDVTRNSRLNSWLNFRVPWGERERLFSLPLNWKIRSHCQSVLYSILRMFHVLSTSALDADVTVRTHKLFWFCFLRSPDDRSTACGEHCGSDFPSTRIGHVKHISTNNFCTFWFLPIDHDVLGSQHMPHMISFLWLRPQPIATKSSPSSSEVRQAILEFKSQR